MNNIILKGIIDEDFVNYKVPSMTLIFPKCSMKCNEGRETNVCQNESLLYEKDIIVQTDYLCDRYVNNLITSAVVCQGLEPFDSFRDLDGFIDALRNKYNCNDDIVIYTGYEKEEISEMVDLLSDYGNIVVKYGRFIPERERRFDDELEVELASDNQYAERVGGT